MKCVRWIPIVMFALLSSGVSAQIHPSELKLTREMQDALRKFNPRFTTWTAADYSTGALLDARGDSTQTRLPFALFVDANRDKRPDLILDGHDDTNSLLLALLSNKQGYTVRLLRSSDLVVPAEIVTFDDGVKMVGLCYALSPTCIWTSAEPFDPKKTFLFQIVVPQRSDSTGTILNVGGSVNYYFDNGRFIAGDFDPL